MPRIDMRVCARCKRKLDPSVIGYDILCPDCKAEYGKLPDVGPESVAAVPVVYQVGGPEVVVHVTYSLPHPEAKKK